MKNIEENLDKWKDFLLNSSKDIFIKVIPKSKGSLKYKVNKNTLFLSTKSVVRNYIRNKKEDLLKELNENGIVIENIVFSILD
jgi:hypothetical protein